MERKKFTWKRLILPIVFCLLVGAVCLVSILSSDKEDKTKEVTYYSYTKDKPEYALENDKLKFVMDAETTQFTVTKKGSNTVWYSNPSDADSDPIALDTDKSNLKSTLLITYETSNGVNTIYNNCSYSVDRDIYSIEAGKDYVKVKYSIGNTQKTFIIPGSMPESEMNGYLEKMDTSQQRQVNNYYRKINLDHLLSTDNKDQLLKDYPELAKESVYVLRDTTQDYLKEKLQQCFAAAGYTEADYKKDAKTTTDASIFDVSVIYRLDGDQLVVEVPMEEMQYNSETPIVSVNVLPYFGAATTKDNGYLFVPEGGGALIDFNNGRNAQNAYVSNLYGWDYATNRTEVVHETKVNFPVFGMAKNGAAFLCIMEDGASYAQLTADVSGRSNSYNSVSATYTTVHAEAYNVDGKSNEPVYVFEKNPPKESIKQRYCFIDSDSYVDMAKAYQNYLVSKYPELTMKEDTSTPVAVEILGAIDKVKHKFGFPVSVPVELTSYKEAQEIVEQLKSDGFRNLSVKYSGWMNGGINQSILNKVDLISELGTKKELKNLLAYADKNQIPLYLNGIVQYAKNSGLTDGFMISRDAARFATKEEAELSQFSFIWYRDKDWLDTYYLLAPGVTQKMITNLKTAAQKYGAQGVSFEDIGNTLSSDLNNKRLVTREESIKLEQSAMAKLKESGLGVMINEGNDYAIPYADFITNMNLQGNSYSIINRSVPFYQIALHGLVNYAGEAINLCDDNQEEILKSAETGAGLSFTFMKQEATALQNSTYTKYFGANFNEWESDAKKIYEKYNQAFGSLFNQKIVDHSYVTDKVTLTTYEDGTKVYVNYGTEDYSVNGITVNARDYAVEKGD